MCKQCKGKEKGIVTCLLPPPPSSHTMPPIFQHREVWEKKARLSASKFKIWFGKSKIFLKIVRFCKVANYKDFLFSKLADIILYLDYVQDSYIHIVIIFIRVRAAYIILICRTYYILYLRISSASRLKIKDILSFSSGLSFFFLVLKYFFIIWLFFSLFK